MKIQVVRKFGFDAAHRLLNHEGKCKYLHGHRYTVHVFVEGALDEVGRVIDFSKMHSLFGEWIEAYWDHTTILNGADPLVKIIAPFCKNSAPYLLPYNPTAENLGRFLMEFYFPDALRGALWKVTKVIVEETPNCRAEVEI